MTDIALLVIDVQESFRHRPYFQAQHLEAFLAAQNALIAACLQDHIPVVRIFHTDGPNTPDNAFSPASGQLRSIDGLMPFEASASFTKSRHSALVWCGVGGNPLTSGVWLGVDEQRARGLV